MKKGLQIIALFLSLNTVLLAQTPLIITRPTAQFPTQPVFPKNPVRVDSSKYQNFVNGAWAEIPSVDRYTFDSQCRTATLTQISRNSPDIRFSYTYNTNNKIISELTETKVNNVWQPTTRKLTTYNSNNYGIQTQTYSNNAWSTSGNEVFEYNSQLFLVKYSSPSRINKFKYNANGKLTEFGSYNYSLILVDTIAITYNSNDFMLTYLQRTLNTTTNALQLRDSSVYTYNTSNFLTKAEVKAQNDAVSPYYVLIENYVLTANALTTTSSYTIRNITTNSTTSEVYTLVNGKVSSIVKTVSSTVPTPVYEANKFDFTYNSSGFMTTAAKQFKAAVNDPWANEEKFTYTLTTTGVLTEAIQASGVNANTWTNELRFLYFANTCTPTPTTEIAKMPATIYPNPASQTLSVKLENEGLSNVRIINAQGQIIKNSLENGTDFTLNIAELNVGLYWIVISKEGKMATHSFVKN